MPHVRPSLAAFAMLGLTLVAGCVGDDPTGPAEATGAFAVPLATSGADGTVYRLTGAQFAITGAETVLVSGDGADVLDQPLPVGEYDIELLPGWTLERDGEGIEAVLTSRNPVHFEVRKGLTTPVTFRFAPLLEGTAAVQFGVAETVHQITGQVVVTESRDSLAGLAGLTVPLTIIFGDATLSFEDDPEFGPRTIVSAEGAYVHFDGAPAELTTRLGEMLSGSRVEFRLQTFDGVHVIVEAFKLRGSQGYREVELELMGFVTDAVFDPLNGYPRLPEFARFEAVPVVINDMDHDPNREGDWLVGFAFGAGDFQYVAQ